MKIASEQKPDWSKNMDKEMPEDFKFPFADLQISSDIETDDLRLMGNLDLGGRAQQGVWAGRNN